MTNSRSVTESHVLDALIKHEDVLMPIFSTEGLDEIAAMNKLRRMADVRRKQAAGESAAAKFNRAAAPKLVAAMEREGVDVVACGYVMEHLEGVMNGMKAVSIMREAAAQALGKVYKATADGPAWRVGSLLFERF